jgi:hypothetical protein
MPLYARVYLCLFCSRPSRTTDKALLLGYFVRISVAGLCHAEGGGLYE